MNKKVIGLSVIALGLIIMALMIYFLFFHKWGTDNVNVTKNTDVVTTTVPETIKISNPSEDTKTLPAESDDKFTVIKNSLKNDNAPLVSSEEEEKLQLTNLSKSFVERFGSFSNQSDFGNISDLEIFMSSAMREWAEKTVADSRAQARTMDTYYGIITQVVGSEFSVYDSQGGKAELKIQTRRRETKDKKIDSFNQNIIVKLIKEDEMWKVASADWAEGRE